MGARLSVLVFGAVLGVSPANAQTPQPQTPPQPSPAPLPGADGANPDGALESPGDASSDPASDPGVAAPLQPPPATPPPPPAPAEPQVIVRGGGISTSNGALLVGSGAGLAAGLCLFLAAQWDDGDAEAAARYEDHSRIAARADRLRIGAAISAGAGIALGVLAAYRIKVSKEGTELAISPKKGGAALVLERSW